MQSFVDSSNLTVLLSNFFAHCDEKKRLADAMKHYSNNTNSSESFSTVEEEKNLDFESVEEDSSTEEICPFLLVITKFLIKDAIDEIITVNKGKKDLPSNEIRLKPFKERMIKYKNLYDTRTFKPIDEALRQMIPIKLQNDIDYARHILQQTLDELDNNRTFTSLKNAVEFDTMDQRDEIAIVEEFCKNKITLNYLENKYENVTKEGKEKIKELNEKMQDLDNTIHFTIIENEIKTRLVKNWEMTRKEQTKFLLAKKEEELLDAYSDTLTKSSRESHLVEDIESFLNLRIDDSTNLTLQWMDKYEKETDEYDTQIQITKEKIIAAQQKNKELREFFETRQEEIKICVEEREKKIKAKALQERQLKAAILLQAWWRGTMVRNQLGPFKKKKKGNKKSNKKKK